jgi:hypothetical protein
MASAIVWTPRPTPKGHKIGKAEFQADCLKGAASHKSCCLGSAIESKHGVIHQGFQSTGLSAGIDNHRGTQTQAQRRRACHP